MAASSDLLTLLEREANAEREQVLSQARAEVERIVAAARKEAEALLEAARQRLQAEAKAAMVKAESTAALHASSMVLQAKEEEIARVFAAAEAELARLASDRNEYPAALQTFLDEALQSFQGQAAVVAINPADQTIVEDLVRQRGSQVTVRPDPSVTGGVRVSTADGRFTVTNTLTSRLERARPSLPAQVARTLWE